jgi:RimJ/RimL family protein N-acetyltransferase
VREYGFEIPPHTPGNIELGWQLRRSHWGRGITTEAAQAIMDVVRYNPGVNVFSEITDVDNVAYIAVMKKHGLL